MSSKTRVMEHRFGMFLSLGLDSMPSPPWHFTPSKREPTEHNGLSHGLTSRKFSKVNRKQSLFLPRQPYQSRGLSLQDTCFPHTHTPCWSTEINMKINSCTDTFYQDPCGHATFHLLCGTGRSQGHWMESGDSGAGEGQQPIFCTGCK